MNEIKQLKSSSNEFVAGSIWIDSGEVDCNSGASMLVEGYVTGFKKWATIRLIDGALTSGWCDKPEDAVDGLELFASEVTIHLEKR